MVKTEDIIDVLENVFSWIILAAIAIIVSGSLLANPLSKSIQPEQKFVINFSILKIQATGNQVIFGFVGFIITFLLCGWIDGPGIYEIVKKNFGVDPGQFQAICMFSSFLTVAWAFLFFILSSLMSKSPPDFLDKNKYEKSLERISNRDGGHDGT